MREDKEKEKNEKIGMILLVMSALCIVSSVYLFTDPNKEPYIPPAVEKRMTNEEADGIANEIITNIFAVYETPNTVFSSKAKVEDHILIRDYDEVIDKLFSINGKKELEQVKFNGKSFVEKKEDGTYILTNIPEEKIYSTWQLTTRNYYITKNSIELEVVLGKSIMKEDNTMSILSMTIDMKLVNVNNKWLVDSFNYNNL